MVTISLAYLCFEFWGLLPSSPLPVIHFIYLCDTLAKTIGVQTLTFLVYTFCVTRFTIYSRNELDFFYFAISVSFFSFLHFCLLCFFSVCLCTDSNVLVLSCRRYTAGWNSSGSPAGVFSPAQSRTA